MPRVQEHAIRDNGCGWWDSVGCRPWWLLARRQADHVNARAAVSAFLADADNHRRRYERTQAIVSGTVLGQPAAWLRGPRFSPFLLIGAGSLPGEITVKVERPQRSEDVRP